MKKWFVLLLLLALALPCAAFADAREDEMVHAALDVLTDYWRDEVYGNSAGMDLDGYLEVKWTRVVYIQDDAVKSGDPAQFADMECFVEFFILSDYFGSHPYYSHAGIAECVAVYEDGSCEVLRMNPLEAHRARSFSGDFSSIIESISDRGSDFNQTYDLMP